jgi:hypothetical protein
MNKFILILFISSLVISCSSKVKESSASASSKINNSENNSREIFQELDN